MKKKYIQNVLAAQSTGEIAYVCGKCGKIIQKEDAVCKHCGARLGDIKCPFCNFRGSVDDFKRDTCPRCGRKNNAAAGPGRKNRTGTGNQRAVIPGKHLWILLGLLLIVNAFLLFFFFYYFDFF